MSRYMHELRADYEAELDDLRTDSDGANVLERRLDDKRQAFDALLPMMGTAPILVAPCLHGAFSFEHASSELAHALLHGEPGAFPSWAEVAAGVGVANWAESLVARALAEDNGEAFLATAVGLEYAIRRPGAGTPVAAEAEAEAEPGSDETRPREGQPHENDSEADEEIERSAEDFLEQQGFDRRTAQ